MFHITRFAGNADEQPFFFLFNCNSVFMVLIPKQAIWQPVRLQDFNSPPNQSSKQGMFLF